MSKAKGDKTPNQLYEGIKFPNLVEGTEFRYVETGSNYFAPQAEFAQSGTTAEDYFVAAVQKLANETRGTDHNQVFRAAGFLNYIHKNGYNDLLVKTEPGQYTYQLPVEDGYFEWSEKAN